MSRVGGRFLGRTTHDGRRAALSVNVSGVETLQPAELRVLGALVEKDMATPEYYPLTLNALQAACNQKSSREPVVHYEEDTILQALELLKNKGLAVRVSGAGHRVDKFGHRLGEKLNLGRRELALLSVLMLRGPQTVGELRGRTGRMHDFTDLDEVERCLETLAARDPDPLVARAPRGRWVQLLGPAPEAPADADVEPLRSVEPSDFEQRLQALEREIAEIKRQFEDFRRQFQ